MTYKYYIGCLVLFLCYKTIHSQTFLEKVNNSSWHGLGELMNSPAQFAIQWDTIFQGAFYRLSFENIRNSDKKNKIVFKAKGYYNMVNDSVVKGNWLDSRGVTLPINGKLTANQMIILWGSKDTEQGKTIYTLTTFYELEVKDFILKNMEYHPFGFAAYKRD